MEQMPTNVCRILAYLAKKTKQIMRLITNKGFTEINGNYRQAACEAGKTLLYLENVQQ